MDRIMRNFRPTSLAIAVALLCATTVSAQERERGQRRERGERDPGQMIKRMDTNGDGKILKDEFTGPERFFERLDADGDGFITEEELASIRQRRGGPGGRRGFRDDGAPKVADMAPTFKLKSLDGKQEFDLASFKSKKPVVLFFGSYT